MVRIEPITLAWAEALAEGDGAFAQKFGVHVEPGWHGFPEVVGFLLKAARGEFGPSEWGPHLFFDDDGALVGNGGWKGPPVDATAELGYSVAPARQGHGIATNAVRQLIERAQRTGLRVVAAHTLATSSASTTVLTRCGFEKVAELVDPVDGHVWRWELHLGTRFPTGRTGS